MTANPSVGQRQILLAQHIAPESTWHNVPMYARITGPADVRALRRAIAMVARRHAALRTLFQADGTVTVTDAEPPIAEQDLTALPADERAAALAEIRDAEERRPFALDTEHPVRATIVRLDDQTLHLILVLHHIVVDGHSLTVLQHDLLTAYRTGTLADPPAEVSDELPDYVRDEQIAYWRDQLAGAPTSPRLPFAAEPTRSRAIDHIDFALPAEVATSVRELAVRRRMTPFMVLLSAFTVLLRRYAGTDDVVVGTPIAGRDRPEVKEIVGYLANTVPLRVRTDPGADWPTVLRAVRDTVLDAYDNADLPFATVIDDLGVRRSPASHPLFQIVFAAPPVLAEPVDVDGVTFAFSSGPGTESLLDIEIQVFDNGTSMAGYLKFRTELFRRTDINRMLAHYELLARHLVEHPDGTPSDIALLTPDEWQQVVVDWNDTATDYPREANLVDLVAHWVRATPDAIAVRAGGEELTYRELDERAARLARVLRSRGVGPGSTVAICHEFAVGWTVAMLAVLRAGGAYVPLDPAYPAARLTMMCEDADVRVAMTRTGLADRITGIPTILLDRPIDDADADLPTPNPTDLAYIMYTSGSTGRPKGVAVTHRNIVRLVRDTNYVHFGPGDVVAQAASLSFDGSTFEIWGALLNGGTLIGIPRDDVLSAPDLARQLRANKVDVMFLTTSLAKQLAMTAPQTFAPLRTLVFGGEQADNRMVARLLEAGGPELVNGYGPTETTTFAVTHTWEPGSPPPPAEERIPIGRPIANTTIYVLDKDHQPITPGRVGEIHIGGDGVARGYVNRPELTNERFVPDPFGKPGGMLYRTGDLGRYREDGVIECLGRIDRQVKLRGFRIEPGEIENCLHETGMVTQATVQVRETTSGPMLVGYVVVNDEVTTDNITDRLRALLPAHLVPSAMIKMESLPVNENGKLDTTALPDPVVAAEAPEEATTPTQRIVLDVWRDVLAMPKLGVHDDFFAIGGHSINAGQVMARLRAAMRISAPLRLIFDNPTVAELAEVLQQRQQAQTPHTIG